MPRTRSGDVRKGDTWNRARRATLKRDGYLCQLGYPGCTTAATECDHVMPLSGGGAWYDLGNLRAVCHSCHTQRPNAASSVTSRHW